MSVKRIAPEKFFQGGLVMKVIGNVLVAFYACIFASTGTAQGLAPAPRIISFDIRAQGMVDALNDWAQQTGMQLIFPNDEAADQLRAPEVKGKFTAQAALEKLIAGSPLTYTFINPKMVAVKQGTKVAIRPTVDVGALKSAGLDVLMASLDETVEVTGSRLLMPRSDLRANPYVETPVPVTVFNREKIESLGVSSISDMLKFLPQQPVQRDQYPLTTGSQQADLRGLGVDMTLVLLNGRRMFATANALDWNTFDLNTIPVTAVERVEVLSDSASAIYGADAVGGVVNVITKKNVSHPTLDLHYGGASGGADERRAALSYGLSEGRLRATLLLDYFDRGFLLGAARDRLNNQDFRRFGGDDWRSAQANPGNITSRTAANLPGLPSRTAAVPSGSTGVGLTPADFLETAGQQNLVSLGKYRTLIPKVRRRNVWASIDFDLTSHANVFGDFLVSDRDSDFQMEPAVLAGVTVGAANPFNPFRATGTAVSVDFLMTGMGPRWSFYEATLYRGLAGIRGTAGRWDWEMTMLRSDEVGTGARYNRVDTARVRAALASSDPALALNPFQDGPGGSPELLASLRDDYVYRQELAAKQVAGVIRGKLVAVPAGDVEAVVGGEWLQSDTQIHEDYSIDQGREVTAFFAELRIPVIAAAMEVFAARSLTVTLAARHDHYSDFGNTLNPQYGLVWKPVDSLMLRASYSMSFRAPSMFELYAPRQTLHGVQIEDPLRNNLSSPVTFVTGGNEELQPTEGDSFSIGFAFAPVSFERFRFSGSYWRIRLDDRVRLLDYGLMALYSEQFPGRIIRAEPTPSDIAAGLPGVITYIDISRVNFGSIETDGTDVAASYSIDTLAGKFVPSVSATWVNHFAEVNVPGLPPVDRVGLASLSGSIPRWRAAATMLWQHSEFAISATARFMSSYQDTDVNSGRAIGRTLAAQTLLDLQASVDVGRRWGERSAWLSGMKFVAGVSNVFDKEPEFSEMGTEYGSDAQQSDFRQRFVYARLSMRFQ